MELTLSQISILRFIEDAPKEGCPGTVALADIPPTTPQTWEPLVAERLVHVTAHDMETARDLRRVFLTEAGKAILATCAFPAPGPYQLQGVTLGKLCQPVIADANGNEVCRLPAIMNAGGKVNERINQLAATADLLAESFAFFTTARAMLNRHDEKARRANFSLCGCPECNAFRPIVEKIETTR